MKDNKRHEEVIAQYNMSIDYAHEVQKKVENYVRDREKEKQVVLVVILVLEGKLASLHGAMYFMAMCLCL